MLPQRNIEKRLKNAQEVINKTKEFRKIVIYGGISKFKIFVSDAHNWCREELVLPQKIVTFSKQLNTAVAPSYCGVHALTNRGSSKKNPLKEATLINRIPITHMVKRLTQSGSHYGGKKLEKLKICTGPGEPVILINTLK